MFSDVVWGSGAVSVTSCSLLAVLGLYRTELELRTGEVLRRGMSWLCSLSDCSADLSVCASDTWTQWK